MAALRALACVNGWPWSQTRARRWAAGTRWNSCWRWRCARSRRPVMTPRLPSLTGRRAAPSRRWPSWGGRRDPWAGLIRPPCERTFRRVFTKADAGALNQALYGYLAALPPGPSAALPEVTRHEREQRRAGAGKPAGPGLREQAAADGKTVRGAVRPDGSQVHLLSVFHVTRARTLAQREVDAKTNEIPELAPAIKGLDLAG